MQYQHKVLLIHPLGYQSTYAQQDIARIANLMPPLGLCSIASYLEAKGIPVDILDCFAQPISPQKIVERVATHHYSIVGISCTTHAFPNASQILKLIRSQLPHVLTVVGGPHISAVQEKILFEHPYIDLLVVGEGEIPMFLLTQVSSEQWHTIPNLIFRDSSGNIQGPTHRTQIKDLDELSFPSFEKLEGYPHLYQLPIFNYPRYPNTSCSTSRGCPYQCSYCDRSVFQRSYRAHSAEYVYRLMQHLKERWDIRHINFYDDQFSLNRQRVEHLCELLIQHPLDITFNCAVRAEHIDLSLLQKMKKAGCWMISLGIETGDPELLARHRSHSNLDRIREAVWDIHRAGIRVKGLFMMGLPGETLQSIQKTKSFIRELPLDDFNLSKFTPFPGSPLYHTIHQFGTFQEDYSKMDCMHFVFIPHGLTEEQLEKEFTHFYRDHFLRPRTLWNYFSMLWKSPHSWYRFVINFRQFFSFALTDQRIGTRNLFL